MLFVYLFLWYRRNCVGSIHYEQILWFLFHLFFCTNTNTLSEIFFQFFKLWNFLPDSQFNLIRNSFFSRCWQWFINFFFSRSLKMKQINDMRTRTMWFLSRDYLINFWMEPKKDWKFELFNIWPYNLDYFLLGKWLHLKIYDNNGLWWWKKFCFFFLWDWNCFLFRYQTENVFNWSEFSSALLC